MNILISDNLKELRKKKNNTQEDLAGFLTVSINAVSKWERGECYPDIEFLPKIASYYDVSVDDLLGVGEIRKRERINEYYEKSKKIQNIGGTKSNLDLWREAKKEFPNDWNVLCSLMHALSYGAEQYIPGNLQEAMEIAEKILSKCTDYQIRSNAIQTLCFAHKDLGNIEKAKEYANMELNSFDKNQLLSHLLKGEELIKHCQYEIDRFTELLASRIFHYARYRGGLEGDEKKRAYQISLKIYELIYDSGDFGFRAGSVSQIYINLAAITANQQNKAETLYYIANSVKYAIIFDTQGDFKHTSLLANRIIFKREDSGKNYMSNYSYWLLKEMEHERYDFCRDDKKFAALLEEVKAVAVSGE